MKRYMDEQILDTWIRKPHADTADREPQWVVEGEGGFIRIDGQPYRMQELRLLDGRVSLMLPSSLSAMQESGSLKAQVEAKQQRKHEQWSFTDETKSIVCTLSWLKHELQRPYLEGFAQAMVVKIKQMRPELLLTGGGMLKPEAHEIAFYECLLPEGEKSVYQVVGMTVFAGRVLMSSFQFPLREVELWQQLAHAAISTLKLAESS
ncbi:hypothetical protein [Paenibacillus sp. Leaf72]|uniref:hypothetical protein n=1 Tax=Paenibacillus sp. Leaf72 TaxID=1736234 RepID=UPI0006FAA756|nr:hypothetical protein [Paenibacillus sp. Leaf72]KQO14759.1 hypothetical protein ASF12_29285 [Paenibacillus sp. Leaf72]